MIITFECPIPPTLNVQIRTARSHWSKSAEAKRLHTNDVAIRAAGIGKIKGNVWLDFFWLVPSRNADPDNISAAKKYIMDGLVAADVIQGDSLMTIQSPVVDRFSKGRNQVVVTISDRPIYEIKLIEYPDANCLH